MFFWGETVLPYWRGDDLCLGFGINGGHTGEKGGKGEETEEWKEVRRWRRRQTHNASSTQDNKAFGKLATDHEADEILLDSSLFAFLVFNFYFPCLFSPSISFHLSSNVFLSTQHLLSLTPAGLPLLVHGELGVWACLTGGEEVQCLMGNVLSFSIYLVTCL